MIEVIIMDKLRKIFEGNTVEKTNNKFTNSIIFLIVSIVGCIACLTSFIIALVNQHVFYGAVFLAAFLVCLNCGIVYLKNKKNKSQK